MSRALLWLLAAVQFTLLLDFMLLMPLGPELLRSLQISAAEFGWAVSGYTFASALAGLAGFFWIDRLVPRHALLILYAAFITATLACGAASTLRGLLAARLIAGASAGLLWSVILALIVNSVPAQQRGGALALVMTSYSVSAVAGVPLGLLFAHSWGFRAPFLILSVVSMCLWFALARMGPNAPKSSRADSAPLDSRPSFEPGWLLGWGLSFMVVFAGFLLIPYLGTFLVNNLAVPNSALGWLYLSGGVATFGSLRLIGWCVDRYGPLRILSALLMLSALSHWALSHLRLATLPVAAFAFVSFMVFTSGRVIPTMVLISARVSVQARPRFLAVNTAVTDAASGSATWLSGALLGTVPGGALVGFAHIGELAVAAATLALLISCWLARRPAASPVELELTDSLEGSA